MHSCGLPSSQFHRLQTLCGMYSLSERGGRPSAVGPTHSIDCLWMLSAIGIAFLERNPSSRAHGEMVQGGFFLRKKPLNDLASGYSNSDFAIRGIFQMPKSAH